MAAPAAAEQAPSATSTLGMVQTALAGGGVGHDEVVRDLAAQVVGLKSELQALRQVPAPAPSAPDLQALLREVDGLKRELATTRAQTPQHAATDSVQARVDAALAAALGQDAAARRRTTDRPSEVQPRAPKTPPRVVQDESGSSEGDTAPAVKRRKKSKKALFADAPASVSPDQHKGFLQWMGSDGKLEAPMDFVAWSKMVAPRWNRAAWEEKLCSRGIRRIPPQRHDMVGKAMRLWLPPSQRRQRRCCLLDSAWCLAQASGASSPSLRRSW